MWPVASFMGEDVELYSVVNDFLGGFVVRFSSNLLNRDSLALLFWKFGYKKKCTKQYFR